MRRRSVRQHEFPGRRLAAVDSDRMLREDAAVARDVAQPPAFPESQRDGRDPMARVVVAGPPEEGHPTRLRQSSGVAESEPDLGRADLDRDGEAGVEVEEVDLVEADLGRLERRQSCRAKGGRGSELRPRSGRELCIRRTRPWKHALITQTGRLRGGERRHEQGASLVDVREAVHALRVGLGRDPVRRRGRGDLIGAADFREPGVGIPGGDLARPAHEGRDALARGLGRLAELRRESTLEDGVGIRGAEQPGLDLGGTEHAANRGPDDRITRTVLGAAILRRGAQKIAVRIGEPHGPGRFGTDDQGRSKRSPGDLIAGAVHQPLWCVAARCRGLALDVRESESARHLAGGRQADRREGDRHHRESRDRVPESGCVFERGLRSAGRELDDVGHGLSFDRLAEADEDGDAVRIEAHVEDLRAERAGVARRSRSHDDLRA